MTQSDYFDYIAINEEMVATSAILSISYRY